MKSKIGGYEKYDELQQALADIRTHSNIFLFTATLQISVAKHSSLLEVDLATTMSSFVLITRN